MNWRLLGTSSCWGAVISAGTLAAETEVGRTPPRAVVRRVADVYHGTTIEDPYRYMENLKDPEVQAWIRGQAEACTAALKSIPGRDLLRTRIKELDAGAPFEVFGVHRHPAGHLYYWKRKADERLPKFCRRDRAGGQEAVLLDPEAYAEGPEKHASIEFAVPSPDGKKVLFGVALSGSEETTLRVKDLSTGRDLPERIDRLETAYNTPSWLPGSDGFVYARRPLLPKNAPATEGYKLSAAHVHRLGEDVNNDRRIFGKGLSVSAAMVDTDFPSVELPAGSKFVLGQVKAGDDKFLTLYVARLEDLDKPQIAWTKICDSSTEVTSFGVQGDDLFVVTSRDAPRSMVLTTKLTSPDLANGRTVVEAGEFVIESASTAEDALYVTVREGGRLSVLRVSYDGGSEVCPIVALPGRPSLAVSDVHPQITGAVIQASSWTRAFREYLYDPSQNKLIDLELSPVGRFDEMPGFEATEVNVRSHDGTFVPLTILHQAGIKLDGSHPCLLQGYGAYGFSQPPGFHPANIAWLERGGVLAVAHVRGGGELGKPWHLAGRMATKPNTWKDFIACAEYLIERRYTSASRLAGKGTSAGGILIGRAVTERPDLFAAAVFSVGCLDALRMETTTNGVPNILEFGSTTTEEGFRGLLAMSAYHHVRDGTAYPAVLLEHGINDPRVEPWMSAKMTARLQAATSSRKPILFRVDYDAGHGIGSTRDQWIDRTTDEWSFLLWQFGEPGFQPEKQ